MTLWLAFEIALTAAFLSTEGRGGWGNWAIGINVHNEVLDGNIHFMLTSTRRVSTLLKVLHDYQSYDLGHHFWGLKCRAGLTRLNFVTYRSNYFKIITKTLSLSVAPFMMNWSLDILKYLKKWGARYTFCKGDQQCNDSRHKYGGDQSYWLLAVVAIARKAILCDIRFLR